MEIIISEFFFGMVHGWPYKGFPKKKIPHIPVPIIGRQQFFALLLHPIISSKAFKFPIMKSFAPSPRLRGGFDDIPPTHPLYIHTTSYTQQIVGEFLCKMSKHWPHSSSGFLILPILVRVPFPLNLFPPDQQMPVTLPQKTSCTSATKNKNKNKN